MSPSRPSAHDDPLDDLAQGSTPAPTHEKAHEAPAQAQHEAPARLPGHLDPRVAERTLKEYEPLIQQCYERQKADLQKQSGKLTMSMVVRSGGRVIEAHASRNTTGSEPLAKCVAQHLRSVVFAPGPTGGNAQYEYAFFFGQ